ncbi:transporter [Mucilaginibacter sp. PPCGB 2223]|uniref:AEC family transporter n=1 Tax=Mucilaginibacter sp. PPCGB 2223 TaxID=1886027 RepID=UPI00082521AC|nr:AEC family transporter [Mucilaginibacter sp. PPCGB 2223]OCX53284.1 transporter [Mucilaginibacter sp. PPCGB 2223]
MVNFILIAICIIAGMLFRASKTLPADAHRGINAWIIYLALPAVSFKYLPHIVWSRELLAPILAPVIVWLGGWLLVTIYTKLKPADQPTKGSLRLMSGLANTSFVGFPLIAAYLGEKYISIAIICDQITFLLLSTAGVVVAINASKKSALSAGIVLKRVLRFPPFLGCVGALVLPHFIDISVVDPLFDKLATTVAPLALFSIGLQLQFKGWLSEFKNISVTLAYKLILAPALVFGLFFCLGFKGVTPQVAIMEAAMPTLLTAGVVADEYDLNPKLSNLIIGIGIILSLLTTAGWYYITR